MPQDPESCLLMSLQSMVNSALTRNMKMKDKVCADAENNLDWEHCGHLDKMEVSLAQLSP